MGKKAVLIGCNYPGTKVELRGCINDVKRMHQCLIQHFHFSKDDIEILIDTDESYPYPTGKNIRLALARLVTSANPGDFLFVHYSGHGTRLPIEIGEYDNTGYNECIVPCDMNLITDDDFRELVVQVPEGCRLTIVSDSCHSGGLIDNAVEQIGESTNTKQEEEGNTYTFGFRNFVQQPFEGALLESRGFNVPSTFQVHRHDRPSKDKEQHREVKLLYGERVKLKSRFLPLSTLIDILKQKTGRDDIDVGKLRLTLYHIFGEDSSPKVKNFMKVIMGKLQHGQSRGTFLGMVGSSTQEFHKQKLNERDIDYVNPALNTEMGSQTEAYAGSSNGALPNRGILISGCQTDQKSADAMPSGNAGAAYGAFSNEIQIILSECNGRITNKELVMMAREKLKSQGYTQRPSLYCSDHHVDASFIC